MIMRVMLGARGLWSIVADGTEDEYEDLMAYEVILRAVPTEMLPMLNSKKTAKEAWDAIKSHRMGSTQVREAKAQLLRREFEMMSMVPGESIEEFSVRLAGVVSELELMGDIVEELRVVQKFLRSAPAKFDPVVASISSVLDINKLSLEDVTGRLKIVEDMFQQREATIDRGDRLLYAHRTGKGDSNGKKFNDKGKRSAGGGNIAESGKGVQGGNSDNGDRSYRGQKQDRKCFNCGKVGHFARNCWEPRKEENCNLTEKKEEEEEVPMLL